MNLRIFPFSANIIFEYPRHLLERYLTSLMGMQGAVGKS